MTIYGNGSSDALQALDLQQMLNDIDQHSKELTSNLITLKTKVQSDHSGPCFTSSNRASHGRSNIV